MNETIGFNIRRWREQKGWTQEHLAAAAGISGRTVQRAEEGRGMSAETLQAIAGALDVAIDELRSNPLEEVARLLGVPLSEVTDELIETKIAEAKDRYRTFPLTIVRTSADLAVARDGDAMHFNCVVASEPARDVAAELESFLGELLDMRGELGPLDIREYEKQMFEIVERLDTLGCAVSVGMDQHSLRLGNGETITSWRTAYVIVAPAAEARTVAVIEKCAPMKFAV